jgi:dihydroflavonol-4-reductase
MKVLITGATGFIGSHIVDQALKGGHQVGVLARNIDKQRDVLSKLGIEHDAVSLHEGDVLNADWESLLPDYDALVHSAGMMSKNMADADKLWALNVTASDVLLTSAVKFGLDPVIHLSSFMAMFPPQGDVIRANDQVREPDSMYAKTKAQAERDARALQASGAPVVCVYPASVNGPDDPTVGSGQKFIADGINEGKMLVTEGGLTFTDVRDLALTVTRLLVPGKGPRRIMSTADYLTHQQILDLMSELSGKDITAVRMPGWVMRLMGRIADLKQKIFKGPTPELTYETAMVLTKCVPQDDAEARAILGKDIIGADQCLRDMVRWMKEKDIIKT